MLQESFPLIFKLREIEIWKNMQKMVAMETSGHVVSHQSYQIVPRYFLEKFAKLGSVCFILKKLLTVKVATGRIRPLPGLDRVKA